MNRINLFINNPINAELDVAEDFNLAFNYSIADIKDISKKNGHWSKTITLKGTQNNNYWFGQLFDVNSDFTFFNPNKKTDCRVLVNTESIIEGFLQLKDIKKLNGSDLQGNEIYYECVIYSDTIDFFTELGAKTVRDLDFTEYGHTYSKTNIENSWTNDYTDAYVYPMYYNNDHNFRTNDFYPAVFLRKVVDKIFEDAGFGWTGSLQYDERFNSEIIPYVGDGTPKISETDVILNITTDPFGIISYEWTSERQRREFYVGVTGSNSALIGTVSSTGNTYLSSVHYQFNDETSSPYYDSDSNWDAVTNFEWTVDRNGVFDIDCRINFNFEIYNPTASTIDSVTVINQGNQAYDPQLKLYTRLVVDNGTTNPYIWASQPLSTITIANSLASIAAGATVSIPFSVTFPNMPERTLNIGDKVYVEIWGENYSTWTTFYYEDSSNNPVDVPMSIKFGATSSIYAGYSNPRTSYIKNRAVIGNLRDGDYLDLNEFLPDKLKQTDIISDIQKRYNLFIQTNPDNNKQLILDPRPNFYERGEILDWTDKKDYDSEDNISFLSDLQSKKMLFTYKSDSDNFNKYYTEVTGDIYGQLEYDFDNDFVKGEKKIESIFSPTPIGDIPLLNNKMVVPCIDTNNPKGNPRILIWGGLKQGIDGGQTPWNLTWIDDSGTTTTTTYTSYPYAGHWNDPYTPTLSNNWGQPKFLYIGEYNSLTDNHLYNRYWKEYIYQIENGKMVTSKFYLTENDISYIKDNFNSKIFIKDSYYYVNSIKDYSPLTDGLTTVELIKIVDGVTYEPQGVIYGANGERPPLKPWVKDPFDFSGPTLPYKPTRPYISLGSTNTFPEENTGVIIGEGNTVTYKRQNDTTIATFSEYGRNFILGDDNVVLTDKSAVIGGDNNTIIGEGSLVLGGDNVTMIADNSFAIATSGVTISTSNTIYLGDNITIDNSTGDITLSGSASIIIGTGGSINLPLSDVLSVGNNTETYDIVMGTGTSITSANGGSQIDFDFFGSDMLLSTDNGGSLQSYIYLSPAQSIFAANDTNATLNFSADKTINIGTAFSSSANISIRSTSDISNLSESFSVRTTSSSTKAILIEDNTGGDINTTNQDVNSAVLIASRNGGVEQNVSNSVVLGGSGITASVSNTVYTPDIVIQTGKSIKSGNGQLDLDSGGDVYLTTDNGVAAEEGLYLSSGYGVEIFADGYGSSIGLYQGSSYISVGDSVFNLYDDTYVDMSGQGTFQSRFGVRNNVGGSSQYYNGLYLATGTVSSPSIGTGRVSAILNSIGSEIEGLSKNGVIIGGENHTISTLVENSVILGGNGITASTSNTAYVQNLNISTLGTGSSISNLGIDINGNVVSGTSSTDTTISVTYTELETLISTNSVELGGKYYITDRRIFLTGIDVDKVSLEGTRIMEVVKETYYIPQTVGFRQFLGIYGQTIDRGSVPVSSGAPDYYAIWGGRLWSRDGSGVDGNTSSDITIDGGGWTEVTSASYYEDKVFNVKYDFDADKVIEQSDWKGNVLLNLNSTNDLLLHTDWNVSSIYDNKCGAIYNNWYGATSAVIVGNSLLGEWVIYNNSVGVIYNNNKGIISNNTTSGLTSSIGIIANNLNIGSIRNNVVYGLIHYNSNIGDIRYNSNDGTINYNTNNGDITYNTNTGNISYNTNNGYIIGATAATGDITDTIVNK